MECLTGLDSDREQGCPLEDHSIDFRYVNDTVLIEVHVQCEYKEENENYDKALFEESEERIKR